MAFNRLSFHVSESSAEQISQLSLRRIKTTVFFCKHSDKQN